jgi:hypothetical protein
MLRGKAWIRPGRYVNVSDSEHAVYARNQIFCVSSTKQKNMIGPPTDRELKAARLTQYTSALSAMIAGVTEDPRIAFINEGWIRQRGNAFYGRDGILTRTLHCDQFWKQQFEWGCSLHEVLVFNLLSGKTFEVTLKELTEEHPHDSSRLLGYARRHCRK